MRTVDAAVNEIFAAWPERYAFSVGQPEAAGRLRGRTFARTLH